MIQSLINKHFFNLLLFTLTFGILLYDAIGFDYTDEICALFLFVLFGISVFHIRLELQQGLFNNHWYFPVLFLLLPIHWK